MQDSLWHRCLRQLQGEVPEQQFNTWVRPLQPLSSDGLLRLFAPNRFVLDWVQQNLYSRIVDIAARESAGGACQVIIEVGSRPRADDSAPPAPLAASPGRRGPPAVVGGRVNPDFTFDTFVEGKSNQLARAAAIQGNHQNRSQNIYLVHDVSSPFKLAMNYQLRRPSVDQM